MPRRPSSTDETVERGSGNVFADLGLPNAPVKHAKVRLAMDINRILDERKLSQAAAAKLLGTGQPKVSALRRYRLAGFSLERLMRFADSLGLKIELAPQPARPNRRRPKLPSPSAADAWSRTPTGEPLNRSPEEKWARLLAHVEEWMQDETGYDERVWPEILRNLNANRMSYRSRG